MAYATRADIEAIYGANHLQTLVAHDVDLDQACLLYTSRCV